MKRYVACYDVSSDRRRLKIMKKLKDKGFHAQRSFFEVEGREDVIADVRDLLEAPDRFALIRLSGKGKIKRIGSLFEGTEWVL